MSNDETPVESRVIHVPSGLLAPSPDWPDDLTFDDWLSKLNILRAKVNEQYQSAHEDWEHQEQTRPREYLDPDALIDAGELERLLEVAFFNLFMSHFERALVERYRMLVAKVTGNTPTDEAIAFSTALKYLEHYLGKGAANFSRLWELSSLRNRLVHDGTKWTEKTANLKSMIERGEIFEALLDDVGLKPEFVTQAVADLKNGFLSISQAVRDYQS